MNNNLKRQQSPSNNNSFNSFSINTTAVNTTNQSIQPTRSNQIMNNHLKQPQNGQDILVAKLRF